MTIKIGDRLNNRYRIVESLGRGGMADVFLAYDTTRSVNIALKLLREDLSEDVVFLRRFKREAQNLAKLQHPNIVRFYGLEDDGIHIFLLQDYIDGPTLRRLIKSKGKPFTFEETFNVVAPICSALNYAHQMGLIHCDIKPANIMFDKQGKVYLTDFGIARLSEGATTATMVGAGTPAYMAPEQILGKDPIPETDIYAVGIVLYEMVTGGERPFIGERARTTGSTSEKVRWEQLHSQPTAPRSYNPLITPQQEQIILKCLEKNPDQRFSSMKELFLALQSSLSKSGSTPINQDWSSTHYTNINKIARNHSIKGFFAKKPTVFWVILFCCSVTFIAVLSLIIALARNSHPASDTFSTQTQSVSDSTSITVLPENSPEPTYTSTFENTSTPTATAEPSITPTPISGIPAKIYDPSAYKCRKGPGSTIYPYDGLIDDEEVEVLAMNESKKWFEIVSQKSQKICWVPDTALTNLSSFIAEVPVVDDPPTTEPISYGYRYAVCNTGWIPFSAKYVQCRKKPTCFLEYPEKGSGYSSEAEAMNACNSQGSSKIYCINTAPFTYDALKVGTIQFTCNIPRVDHSNTDRTYELYWLQIQ